LNNLTQRIISGLIGSAILVGSIIYSSHSFFIAFLLISVFMQHEYNRHVTVNKHVSQLVASILNVTFSTLSYLYVIGMVDENYLLLLFPFSLLILITSLYDKAEMAFKTSSNLVFAMIYVVLPFILFIQLPFMTGEGYVFAIPLGVMLFLWAGDTGAYFAGKSFGKTKLFERISPKKTWEGAIGGLLFALLMSYIVAYFFKSLTLTNWMIIGLITFVFGAFGDLVESLFKRNIGIKDSGRLIPGHGGFLDRFDGLLLAAPMVYIYLKLFVN